MRPTGRRELRAGARIRERASGLDRRPADDQAGSCGQPSTSVSTTRNLLVHSLYAVELR